ncbi:hypothetical protein [Sodalis sp. dw_96]|uniref:hypothetical protein n=1 Tax=Sodalis sp. dw_96 TaxID=2719794 RepID=UPI001BD5E957|nr:hypothetical protein [Sodalis sp. dw_96]
MNTIGFPFGRENIHGNDTRQDYNPNMLRLMLELNKASNVNVKLDEAYQQISANSKNNRHSTEGFRTLVTPSYFERESLEMLDSLPLDLTLSKPNDAPSHQIEKSKNLLSKKLQYVKHEKEAKPYRTHWASHDMRTYEEKCSIVLEACHPYSNCSRVAKKYDIPHQYIFNWSKKHFSMTIKELKKCLENIYINYSPSKKALVLLDTIIYFNEIETKKKSFTLSQKEDIIKEACDINKPVYEIAKHHDIAVTSIHRWCKNIYNLTLNDFRKKHWQNTGKSQQTILAGIGAELLNGS